MENELVASNVPAMLNPTTFEAAWQIASTMANSKSSLPVHFHDKPDECFAVIMKAIQWRMSPYAVAEKTHIIGGVMGYEAQLLSAIALTSGELIGGFHFEWFGPWENILGKVKQLRNKLNKPYFVPDWTPEDEKGLGIKVTALIKGQDKPTTYELYLCQALVRNSTNWAADPKLQLAYLSEKKFIRLHTPHILLGVYTPDELYEITRTEPKDITPQSEREPESQLNQRLILSEEALELEDKLNNAKTIKDIDQIANLIKKAVDLEIINLEERHHLGLVYTRINKTFVNKETGEIK